MIRAALLALPLLASGAVAQEAKAPTPYDRAIAAGYKALTMCSAMFIGGRTQAQVEALELTGTYPEYDALLPKLTAKVDQSNQRITVEFDPAMPPRLAEKGATGCTINPIGAAVGGAMIRVTERPGSEAPPEKPWPLGDGKIAPRPSPKLTAAVSAAFTNTGPRTVGVVVIANGKIAAERYADGFGPFTANRTWSVAKSLTGTLVGVAVQQGIAKTGDPAVIPEWRTGSINTPGIQADAPADPRAAITLDQLIHMASGLHSATGGSRTDAVYFGGTAVTEETVAWPLEVKPGTRFRYANNDILLAMRSLRASMGDQRYATFPDDALFKPLGMRHTVAERDWKGNYILSSQVWSTARDLARFGMLYLNDGVWDGKRILPEGWVKYVATPSGPQPDGEFGYGATFWLLNKSPGVPADTFAAFGNRGQYVVIVPSRKVVIVRRGEDATGARFDIAKFTADVLAALK